MLVIIKISEEMMNSINCAMYTKNPKIAMERLIGKVAEGIQINQRNDNVWNSFDAEVIVT